MKSLIAFTLTYIALGTGFAVAGGNWEFIFYIAVMAVLITATLMVHARVQLTMPLLWCLSFWGLAHLAGGMLTIPESWPAKAPPHVLYNFWFIPGKLKYDQVVHAYGFGVTTWLCWQALRAALASRTGEARASIRPSFGLAVLCIAAGMGFGALNEIVEFAATLLVPETNVGGYINTGWDLVSNFVGAVTAMILISAKKGTQY